MPLDLSIYQMQKPVEAPSLSDSMGKAMGLSAMAMQQQRMGQQIDQEDKEAKIKAHLQKASIFGNAIEGLSGVAPQERPQAYASMRAGLIQDGVISGQELPEQEDPGLTRQYYSRWKNSQEGIEAQLKKSMIAKNLAEAAKDRGVIGGQMNPLARLEKAGGEVKQKIGHITSGLQSLTQYEDAFRNGGRQGYVDPSTPGIGGLISSKPIDEARTSMEEAIGRLASGGAINKDEEARFRRMLPRAADTDEEAARKIMNIRKDMEGKLTAYGFKTDDLGSIGYKPTDLGYGTEFAAMKNRGLYSQKENAGNGAPGVSNVYAGESPPPPARPKFNQVEDGYRYIGPENGDPSDKKNWKKVR